MLQDTIRVACVHATLVIAKMLNADELESQQRHQQLSVKSVKSVKFNMSCDDTTFVSQHLDYLD